jgi:hypothetical protein
MIQLVRRFFEDIHRIANFITANPQQDTTVTLSPEAIESLANFRRNKPRAKKEVA